MSKKNYNENSKTKSRVNIDKSLSRLVACQIFYQFEFFEYATKIEQIQKDLLENYFLKPEVLEDNFAEQIDKDLLQKLLFGMEMEYKFIDQEISELLSKDWKVESIDSLAKQMIRFGIFELKFFSEIPAIIVIDEYIEIAASFFDEKIITFVNAVLDKAAKKIRPQEFQKND